MDESDNRTTCSQQHGFRSPSRLPTDSFWLDGVPPRGGSTSNNEKEEGNCMYTSRKFPKAADVLIIGGGVTGMSTAYWLAKSGNLKNKTVVLIESREISYGASGRNGGILMPDPRVPFEMDCFKLIEDFLDEYQLHSKVDFYKSTALYSPTREQPSTIKPPPKAPFLVLEGCQWWTAKFVYCLLEIVLSLGVKVFTQTTAETVISNDKLVVITDKGAIEASNVVYATNGYTGLLLESLKDVIVPVRGQVICTAPLSRTYFENTVCWEDEYLIQRKKDNRIVFGGFRRTAESGREEVGVFNDDRLDRSVSSSLREALKNLIEEDASVEYEWTGIMGFSPDRKPLIGELPRRVNCNSREFIAAGYTGHGMPYCFKAGQVISSMICGVPPPPLSGPSEVSEYSPCRFLKTGPSKL